MSDQDQQQQQQQPAHEPTLADLRATLRAWRRNGTPEGAAAYIAAVRDAQLAAIREAGEQMPPTIRDMNRAAAEPLEQQFGRLLRRLRAKWGLR